MNLGQLLKSRRKELNLTQTDVGKAIGVSTNTISKYERNIIENMGRDKVLKLSKLLDIPTVKFIELYNNGRDDTDTLLSSDDVTFSLKKDNKTISREEFLKGINELVEQYIVATPEELKEIKNYIEYISSKINIDDDE